MAEPPRPRKPFVVKTRRRDIAAAVLVGLAVLALILWAMVRMARDTSDHALLTGTVLSKHFEPQKEEQLTVGPGGLDRRDIDGIYTMAVRTPDGHLYTVYVEKRVYDSHNPGDELAFLPPPRTQ